MAAMRITCVPQQKDLIVLNDVHRVFAIDALTSSHPLSSKAEDIQKPAQISELFDAISYSKVTACRRVPLLIPALQRLTGTSPLSGSVCSEDAVGFPV